MCDRSQFSGYCVLGLLCMAVFVWPALQEVVAVGCDRSQFSGHCVQSVCWVCCVCLHLCGLFSRRWLQRGCDRSQFSGHCMLSL